MRLPLLALCLFAACAAEPRWLKGNLHTHSLWSDGNDFPEVITLWYKDRGYDFLAISDHNTLQEGERWMKVDDIVRRNARTGVARYREQFGSEWVETRTKDGKLEVRLRPLDEYRVLLEEKGRFLIIQSEEITDKFDKSEIHINATNIVERIEPQHGTSVRDVMRNNLRAVAEQSERLGQPIVAHLNHPNFRWSITAEDLAAVVEERFFEVYNGHPDTGHEGDETHASVEQIWDIANTLRLAEMSAPPLFGLAVDDSHNYFNSTGSIPGRGWVMVRATELTPDAVCDSLAEGDFYASSGVQLDEVQFADNVLSVQIRGEPGVSYRTEFRGTRRGYNRATAPVMQDGKEVKGVTMRYSSDVGEVFAVIEGERATYRLSGDELYVRAIVKSDKAPEHPAFDGEMEQAWTQPVGWRWYLRGASSTSAGSAR